MFNFVSGTFGKILLGACALISPSGVSADEIALTFEDHGFTISGVFAGFAQDAYVIETENGLVHVPVDMVTCEGEACFMIEQASAAEG